MQEVTVTFNIILKMFTLFMAFFCTLAYFNQVVGFIMSVYSKRNAKILPGNMVLASVFWTLYIVFF